MALGGGGPIHEPCPVSQGHRLFNRAFHPPTQFDPCQKMGMRNVACAALTLPPRTLLATPGALAMLASQRSPDSRRTAAIRKSSNSAEISRNRPAAAGF